MLSDSLIAATWAPLVTLTLLVLVNRARKDDAILQDDVESHISPTLMQEEHICHGSSSYAHTSTRSNAHKCSSRKNTAPCTRRRRSAVGSDTESRHEYEEWSPAIDVRNRRPNERGNTGEDNRYGGLVRGLDDSDVLGFCEWNIARVDQSLGKGSQEGKEGYLEQDPYLQPPSPVEGVWQMLASCAGGGVQNE